MKEGKPLKEREKGKTLHNLIDFIFFLLKNIVRFAVISTVGVFILLVLALILPDNATEVVNIIKNLNC